MNRSDQSRNAYMLCGSLAKKGYLRWWHSFSGISAVTGIRRFFFVEYLILNPVPGKQKKDRSAIPSYVKVSAGIFPDADSPGLQLASYHPITAAKYAKKPLYFQVGDNVLRENRIVGRIKEAPAPKNLSEPDPEEQIMEWDLEIHKTIACHTGFLASPFLSALNALDSFWHGEGIKTHYRGNVVVNGETFEISPDDCSGYADKHWGRSYNKPWLQLASCNLISERTGKPLKHSALAIDGCCPRFLFFRFKPKMLLQLTYTGEDFCYSFARILQRPRLKWGTKETKDAVTWHVKAGNRSSLVTLTLQSPKQKMMALSYDEPDPALSSPRLKAGCEGYGSLDLYRITPSGKVWLDTLTIQNALCEFEKPVKKASAH